MIRKSLKAGIFHVIRILLLNEYFKVELDGLYDVYTLTDVRTCVLTMIHFNVCILYLRTIYLAWL